MEIIKLRDTVIKALQEKNGLDIKAVNLDGRTIIADYFIIATGNNGPHLRALADYTEEQLEANGVSPLRKEGVGEGRWIVLDYGSIIVHLFNRESRDYYCLEKLWGNGDNITVFN
ncbi:MAG: ribosome silencing factor [Christensenellales bacterium]|jgi:ribosome-associated protein